MAELAEITLSGPENKNGKLLRGYGNISVCLEQELKTHIPKYIDNSIITTQSVGLPALAVPDSKIDVIAQVHTYIHLQAHQCLARF